MTIILPPPDKAVLPLYAISVGTFIADCYCDKIARQEVKVFDVLAQPPESDDPITGMVNDYVTALRGINGIELGNVLLEGKQVWLYSVPVLTGSGKAAGMLRRVTMSRMLLVVPRNEWERLSKS